MRRSIAFSASFGCFCCFTGWTYFNYDHPLLSKWRDAITLSDAGRVPASLQSAAAPTAAPARIGLRLSASAVNASQSSATAVFSEVANLTANTSRPASSEPIAAAPLAATGREDITDPLRGQSWSSLSARPRECVAASSRHLDGRSALHLHLHNYGGTFQCALARRQGECTNPPWCNFEGCSEVVKSRLTPCWKRLRATHYTWIFEERGFNDDDISCTGAQIVYVILRDPLAALESTLNANHFVKSHVLQAMRHVLDGRSGPAPSLRRPSAGTSLDALLRHDGWALPHETAPSVTLPLTSYIPLWHLHTFFT